MARVQDKVAIVTGGGKGIGKACSILLAQEGAKVVLTQRHEQEALEVVETIGSQGGSAVYVQQDVTKEEDWEKVLNATQEEFGSPNILVNNAGIYIIESVAETSIEQWNKLMAVNATGVFLGMKHCASVMEHNGGGSIVNMSSVAGLIGVPNHALYGASKGAVTVMTKDTAMEYARRKVRVNSVHPGYIDTHMADYGAKEQETTKEGLGQWHPMGDIGKPMDVAYGVLYLASDEARFVTGAELAIDGGLTAQ